jgi:DNA modification methylase
MKLDVIYNEDCIEGMSKLPDECVDLVITSPPYNCRRNYTNVSDERPWSDYYVIMERALEEIYRILIVGGTVAVNVPLCVRWQRDHAYANTWADYDPDYPTHRQSERVYGKGRIEPLGIKIFNMMAEIDIHMREPIVWIKGSKGNAISTTYKMGCDSDPYMRPVHEHILLGSKAQWYHRGGTGRRGKDYVPFADYTKDVWFIPPVPC